MASTYRTGYQDALRDVAWALKDGGYEKACRWIADTAEEPDTKDAGERYAKLAEKMPDSELW